MPAQDAHPAIQQLLITTANALDACAALFRAQMDRDAAESSPGNRGLDDELARLDALAGWVESAVHPLLPGRRKRPAPGVQAAATAIAAAAHKAVRAQRAALHKKAPRKASGVPRAVMPLLEKFLRTHALPSTQWRVDWRAVGPDKTASATIGATAPDKFELEFSARCESWDHAVSLSALGIAELATAKIETFVGKVQPNRAPKRRLVSLRGYHLWSFAWAGNGGTIRLSKSAKKPKKLLELAFVGNGPPSVVAIALGGGSLGPAASQTGLAATVLVSIATAVGSISHALVDSRDNLLGAQFEGAPIDRAASPDKVGRAILEAFTPTLRNARGPAGQSLLPTAELRKKFDGLAPAYLELLDRAGLSAKDGAAIAKGSGASKDVEDALLDDSNLPPTLIRDRTEPLFGSNTIDRKFDDLDLETDSADRTNPGYKRPPRRATA